MNQPRFAGFFVSTELDRKASAIPKAVNDGDMTTEDATALGNLLEQSTDGLTSDGLTPSVAFLTLLWIAAHPAALRPLGSVLLPVTSSPVQPLKENLATLISRCSRTATAP